jgi:hypothetical protein
LHRLGSLLDSPNIRVIGVHFADLVPQLQGFVWGFLIQSSECLIVKVHRLGVVFDPLFVWVIRVHLAHPAPQLQCLLGISLGQGSQCLTV